MQIRTRAELVITENERLNRQIGFMRKIIQRMENGGQVGDDHEEENGPDHQNDQNHPHDAHPSDAGPSDAGTSDARPNNARQNNARPNDAPQNDDMETIYESEVVENVRYEMTHRRQENLFVRHADRLLNVRLGRRVYIASDDDVHFGAEAVIWFSQDENQNADNQTI